MSMQLVLTGIQFPDASVQTTAAFAAATGVTTLAGGTTGLTPSAATNGAITLAGTLNVTNGGTGVTTSTGSGATVRGTSPTLITPNFNSAPVETVIGAAPLYMARAWVTFNGSTTAIGASGNVSSVTRGGTAYYTVNFTTNMPDVNYAVTGTGGPISSSAKFLTYTAKTVGSVDVGQSGVINAYAVTDLGDASVAIFR
ncbi:hypothetical protein UFOVP1666_49 [uncultured Caudovirales phage]|uniref:Uncharacterized protein n=1 Tax=uncultured Caudovirales phage TaxID=2100421 RepID=A0A6J5PI38_9CAUD|nr:hypothetical protein UFOVP867_4 [uncultured Caudovirales phage]CAB4171123.1 hypothetical protein UFOVP913_194 [uncultured Caudovirales phage]CAB4176706.1 hypothetical protein UFOVP993_50 [uncultured Caudovirales phage]CAB4223005.1 hypothetical protein UFOVP1666_49 [uncultured Caudovirales phage]